MVVCGSLRWFAVFQCYPFYPLSDYSPYSSVTEMLDNLGWRLLELRRYNARIAMFYKIVYDLVAIPVPSYFEHPMVQTHHHPLANRQIHSSVCYYFYSFFPIAVILWNKFPGFRS